MKQLFSILILSLILIQNTFPHADVFEVQRLKAIYSHFMDHREADGDSLLEFIYEDFLSDQGEEEGHHGSEPLDEVPFQSYSNSHCCSYTLPFNCFCISLVTSSSATTIILYKSNYTFLYLDSIFQPPQV